MGVPRLLLIAFVLAVPACAERPVIGVEIGTQTIQNCIPGTVSGTCI
jgi:hypothetical protein